MRSIGFIPILLTVTLGSLFVLKFQRAAQETEYALQLRPLINEEAFGLTTVWETRRKYYFEALAILARAENKKLDAERVIDKATEEFGWPEEYRQAFADSFVRNLRIGGEMALLDGENLDGLGSRASLQISVGGFAGQYAVLGNVIPHRYSPEMELRFVNLLLKPERLAEEFPDKIESGALGVMNASRSVDLITESSYARTMAAARSSGQL